MRQEFKMHNSIKVEKNSQPGFDIVSILTCFFRAWRSFTNPFWHWASSPFQKAKRFCESFLQFIEKFYVVPKNRTFQKSLLTFKHITKYQQSINKWLQKRHCCQTHITKYLRCLAIFWTNLIVHSTVTKFFFMTFQNAFTIFFPIE